MKPFFKTMLLACISLMSTNAKAYDGVFRKITSVEQLTTGYYVIVGSEDANSYPNYAMGAAISSGIIKGVSVNLIESKSIKNPNKDIVWKLVVTNNTCTFQNCSNNKYLHQYENSNMNMQFSDSPYNFTINQYSAVSPIGFQFTTDGTSNNHFIYNGNNKQFYNFANNYTTTNAPFRLFKLCDDQLALDETETTVNDIDWAYSTITMTRTMKQGVWNSFCAPFDMTNLDIKSNFGDEVQVMKLTTVNVVDDNYNMTFADERNSIAKNTPYMVKPTKDVSSITVNNADVVVDNSSLPQKTVTDNNGHSVTFHGNYAKGLVPRGAYFISGGNFYLADSDVTLKGYRGYITINGASAKEVTYSFSDTDGIKSVSTAATDNKAYNLAGQRVDANTKGIIIVNGRKVINK